MKDLNLSTNAFPEERPHSTGAAARRKRTKLPTGPGALRSIRLRVIEGRGTDLNLRVEANDGDSDSWSVVRPDLSRDGLQTLLMREERVERIARRYGLSVDAFLDSLSASAVDTSDGLAGIPDAELEALSEAGVRLDGPSSDPSGAAAVARGAAAAQELLDNALTVADAAEMISLSPARVRQMISHSSLLTVPSKDGSHLIPAWQLDRGSVLPGLSELAPNAHALHPLTLARFMTRTNPDLDLDGHPATPAAWLATGGDPSIVADLAEGLRVSG